MEAAKKLRNNVQTTNASSKYRNERKLHNAEKKAHAKTKAERDEAYETINAQANEIEELNQRIKDYQARFTNGGIVYTVNNGYVSSAVEIPPYSEWTYKQPIPKEIGTRLYKQVPFVKIEDRQLKEDAKQKTKYKGVLI
jgi:hypothetical protein